jgi:hypothetical protein
VDVFGELGDLPIFVITDPSSAVSSLNSYRKSWVGRKTRQAKADIVTESMDRQDAALA